MSTTRLPLFLFAKAPIPGKVKTRLQSHCSAEQAADIAKVLLEESLFQATTHWPGKVYLSTALDVNHPFLQAMCDKYKVQLVEQCAGDLGEKMHGAFKSFGYPAAIMGCDAPHIKGDDFVRAHSLLLSGQPVLGPSEDGGYYFIGLPDSQIALFQNVDWGTDVVLSQTLDRASEQAVDFQMLTPLNDVDEWQDLVDVAKGFPSLALLVNKGLCST